MSDDNDLPYFLTTNRSFAEADPADDFLHPEMNAKISHATLTETQYFGFSVPEQGIHSYLYLWHHPNLKTVSGGAIVFQGKKRHPLQAELHDFQLFMDDSVLADDIGNYRLANGYGVKVVEPLKRHHVTYHDAERGNSFDLHYEAIFPPVMTADRTHFEQAMKVDGEVTLRGKSYAVDCFTIRDRSWGKPRQEANRALPPLTIGQGVFSRDFAFSCFMFDDLNDDPALSHLALPKDKLLATGSWIYRDGAIAPIVMGHKTVERDPDSLRTDRVIFDVQDELGRKFTIVGTTGASAPTFGMWPNQMLNFNSITWECDGHIGHGDGIDAFQNDYLQSLNI